MNPVVVSEMVGVQTSENLCLITPVFQLSPEADTRLMPGGGQDGVLSFGTVDREEIQRLMVRIVQADGHDDVSGADVELSSPE